MNYRILLCLSLVFCLMQNGRALAGITLTPLVDGKPVRLLLDTRSGNTLLFAHGAERIGLEWTPPEQAPEPGRLAAGRSKVCSFDTGSGPLPFVFAVVDLPQYQQKGIDGVLSWASLTGNILFLDGEQRQFSAIGAIPEFAREWQQYPIKQGVTGLIMQTGEADILIDTGNDGGVRLKDNAWNSWLLQHKDAPSTLEAYSTPQRAVAVEKVCYAEHFAAGNFELDHTLVGRDNSTDGSDYDISLGMAALAHLNIIVDGPNKVFYLQQVKDAPAPSAYNHLGAVFVPADINTSEFLTAVVAQGSPAAQAGIRNGDALLRLGDLDVTKWRTTPGLLPLSRFWDQPAGTRLSLLIGRNGKATTVDVTLKDFLGTEKSGGAANN